MNENQENANPMWAWRYKMIEPKSLGATSASVVEMILEFETRRPWQFREKLFLSVSNFQTSYVVPL